jgi:hypothetical protein
VALLACAGCTKKSAEPKGPGRIVTLETDTPGLSGLTRDEHGALWAPAENGEAVLRIDPSTFGVTHYPVVGAPEGADLEALTLIEGTRFVLGTETQEKGRTRDVVLDGRLEGDTLKLTPIGHLEYVRWQMTARDNHGIEGACHADGMLVLATELVEEEGGRRWAPVGVFDPKTQTWAAHRVALSTDKGKLAALDCRSKGGVIEALAVERHYEVSRLLRFDLPVGPTGHRIESQLAADLAELISPLPNFEGLVWMDDGSAVLLNDNQDRGASRGPSRLFFVPASAVR